MKDRSRRNDRFESNLRGKFVTNKIQESSTFFNGIHKWIESMSMIFSQCGGVRPEIDLGV